MKKVISIFLILIMVFTLSSAASAEYKAADYVYDDVVAQVESPTPELLEVPKELGTAEVPKSTEDNMEDSDKENSNFLKELSELPEFTGEAYIEINDNFPFFTLKELTIESFESYADLDKLGRCGVASACVGIDLMPEDERGSIGMVQPSGWKLSKYDFIDGSYLYNRCHLIGYQLTGENGNVNNLITGTRYLNIMGMLPFENKVYGYIKETGNHVMYRVSPVFEGENLLASGVLMEGWSVEDAGKGVCYCVYVYNAEPGVEIDYANGENKAGGTVKPVPGLPACPAEQQAVNTPAPVPSPIETQKPEPETQEEADYILNTNSHKFHLPSCKSVSDMSESNKVEYKGSRDDLIAQGYSPCKRCKP